MLRNFEEMAIIEIKTESPVTDSLADRWEQTNPPYPMYLPTPPEKGDLSILDNAGIEIYGVCWYY